MDVTGLGRPPTKAEAWLEAVHLHGSELEHHRDSLKDAMKNARYAGCTLEQIAQAAGLSRARIHQILKG